MQSSYALAACSAHVPVASDLNVCTLCTASTATTTSIVNTAINPRLICRRAEDALDVRPFLFAFWVTIFFFKLFLMLTI